MTGWQHIDRTGPEPRVDYDSCTDSSPAGLWPGQFAERDKPRENCTGCGAPPSLLRCDYCGRRL